MSSSAASETSSQAEEMATPGDSPDNPEGGEAVTQPIDRRAAFIVDLDGFEGPLDLLLNLAQSQKVDLKSISILQLADQYLAYIAELRKVRLEIAADYLVMAAWLAYLKSRLLLPEQDDEEEESGEALAERLQFQLMRLQAMRQAVEKLLQRNRLGLDVFPRGAPEPVRLTKSAEVACTLYDLLNAYAQPFREHAVVDYIPKRPAILSVEDAIGRLQKLLGRFPDWATLESYLPEAGQETYPKRSAIASTFAALLELTKRGETRLKQGQTFGPIFVKASEQHD